MDQRHLAGVGNIYANEALFAAGIDPSKPARRLTPDDHRRLHAEIRRILQAAIASNGTTVPRLPHRHRRAGQLPARAARLRPRGRALPSLRHAAHRDARDRRAASPSSAIAASREPLRRAPSAPPRCLRPTSTSSASGCARSRRTGPAIYRMMDATGRVLYVGKAKRLRTRLLTYFRAEYPDDKAARILYAAQRHRAGTTCRASSPPTSASCARSGSYRPHFNYRGNRDPPLGAHQDLRRPGAAGRTPAATVARDDARCYGPFRSLGRTARGGAHAERSARPPRLRARRCRWSSPARATSSTSRARPACMRHEFGFCSRAVRRLRDASGTTGGGWRRRWRSSRAAPSSRSTGSCAAMQEAAAQARFELAARWREKFEQLEWLLAATSRARTARRPAHVRVSRSRRLRRRPGLPRAAGRRAGVVSLSRHADRARGVSRRRGRRGGRDRRRPPGPLPLESIDEILLLMSWFRAHPEALRRTTPLRGLGSGGHPQGPSRPPVRTDLRIDMSVTS